MSLHWPRHVPITVSVRGGHPENVHHGSFAVVDRTGQVLATAGDVDTPVFTRSSLKPFQALPLIARAVHHSEGAVVHVLGVAAAHAHGDGHMSGPVEAHG